MLKILHSELVSEWGSYWRKIDSISDSSPYARWLRAQRLKLLSDIFYRLPKRLSILDVGCGSGETLAFIKSLGFKNSIGIDYSADALEKCERNGLSIGKDVFLMDATKTTFEDRQFDIVHEEGVWEHFSDCRLMIKENVRVSDKFIFAFQPNHFSLMGAILKFGGLMFKETMRELKEYSYPLTYFTRILDSLNFKLILTKYTLLHEQAWLVYVRGTL